MSEMVFNNGSVPVAVAAKVYKKDPCWVRAGLIAGWLPIGFATRDGKLIKDIQQINSKFGRINYYISPKKLYEETGYMIKLPRVRAVYASNIRRIKFYAHWDRFTSIWYCRVR